ncbi:type IX secretion system sortase PorU [Aquirufa aurantiipilula]|uniref:type IX secretion system sortase PorU n=1 Tax=Aquirufa aurantiipilula TaxID=2696561 RepID=UPI001CAA4AE8|nr:type IX secretion system sortase PorU [Aquirufa aurantiipilula]MBZ1327336.1 type IX secretion system sortase PorU [Aquirufa aurantiipilula]
MPKLAYWKINLMINPGQFFLGFFLLFCTSFISLSQTHSVLSEGEWTKIAIGQTGVYQINKEWLRKNNIDPSRINPQKVVIYQGHRGILPQLTTSPRISDLEPIPSLFLGEENGIWDESDQISFYAESSHLTSWDKNQKKWITTNHPYSDSAFYFIRWDSPKSTRIKTSNWETGSEPFLDYAWSHFHYQPDLTNAIQSGRAWLGDAFYGNSEKIIQYPIKDYKEGKAAQIFGQLASSSVKEGTFSFTIENNTLSPWVISSISGDRYDQKIQTKEFSTWVYPIIKNNQWSWKINYANSVGTGYLNSLSLNYPRILNATNENPLYYFTNTGDSTFTVSIQNLGKQHQIWFKNGEQDWLSLNNTIAKGKITAKPGSQLLLFDPIKLNTPIFIQHIDHQDINQSPASELIIVSSPALRKAAEKLAQYKNSQVNLKTSVISTDLIYHEYSGGKQDVTAIRDFLYNQKNRADARLRYVILLGDASVDYKNKNSVANATEKASYVPTYESRESHHPLLSYASDDYYGFLAPGQGEWTEGNFPINESLSIGVGRLTARNPQEAMVLVNKLIDYSEKQKSKRASLFQFSWIADDGDSNLHVQDAEDFSASLSKSNPLFPNQKIYLDQYPMALSNGIYTSSTTKLQVKKAWEKQGDFIHFIGHGAETVWTDEKIWTTEDIQKLYNAQHLPWVLTATCQFGRFDDPNVLSGAELSLVSNQGGAIGLISTTRPVFQSSNYVFGQAFYRLIQEHSQDSNYRMGDLFRDTKNQSHAGVINRNISLLGDPSLELPWNYQSINLTIDTLTVGSEIAVPIPMPSFLDEVELYLISPKRAQKTLGTKTPTYTYETEGELFWKISSKITDGKLSFSPKSIPQLHINTSGVILKIIGKDKFGKIWAGAKSVILKASNQASKDTQAPNIQIGLVNEPNVLATSTKPLLEIQLKDDVGFLWQKVNGEISYLLVNDTLKVPLLDYFQPSAGSANEGKVLYPFRNLPSGNYKIQVKCYDVNNNMSESTFRFQVSEENLTASFCLVFPNPFLDQVTIRLWQDKFWSDYPYNFKIINLLGQTIVEKTGNLLGGGTEYLDLSFVFNENEIRNIGIGAYYILEINDMLGSGFRKYKGKIATLK